MSRSLNIWVAAALAVTIGAPAIAAPGAPAPVRPRHHVVHAGDIVVHARRSYLDPGLPSWSEAGTGNRYVTDAAPSSMADFGMPFAAHRGFDPLPSRFNPPGRPEPLFEF
jgi:hypothetical protein